MPFAMLTMKRVACFSFSVYACGSVPIVIGLRLAAFRAPPERSYVSLRTSLRYEHIHHKYVSGCQFYVWNLAYFLIICAE